LFGLGILGPETLRTAEVGDAGLGGDAGAGQDDDLLRVAQPTGDLVEFEVDVHGPRRYDALARAVASGRTDGVASREPYPAGHTPHGPVQGEGAGSKPASRAASQWRSQAQRVAS